MASKQSTVDFIVGQIAAAGTVTAKKMFGEYGIYYDGKVVALVCDDELFVKPTTAGKAFSSKLKEAPPYPDAKPSLLVPADKWDEPEWLSKLIRITATELPVPSAQLLASASASLQCAGAPATPPRSTSQSRPQPSP